MTGETVTSWWRRWRRRRPPSKQRAMKTQPPKKTVTISLPYFLLFFITFLVFFLTMTPSSLLNPVGFVEGEVFPHDLRAFRTVRYFSESATERERERVAEKVPKVYRLDPSVAAYLTAVLSDFFDTAVSLRQSPIASERKARPLREKLPFPVPDAVFMTLLRASPPTLRFMQATLFRALRAEWKKGIKPSPEAQKAALRRVKEHIDRAPLRPNYRWALKQLAEVFVQPNMVFDPIATEQAKRRARQAVAPIWRTVRAGEIIARKGELVTREHLEKLHALGYNLPALIGIASLALLLTFGVASFLKKTLPETFRNTRHLLLLSLIWLPSLLITRFLSPLLGHDIILLTIVTAAMTTAVMLHPLISVFASVVAALTTTLGMAMDWQTFMANQLRPFLSAAISGVTAAFLCADLKTRFQLLQAGFFLGLMALAINLVVGLITGELPLMDWSGWQQLLLWSALTATIPPALTLIGISLLEHPFRITTVFTLMELSSPHAPLLRELAEKAPGTFQSALMVARLAQEAARRIGANELLAWTGSLYHDIGKLAHPRLFVENQAPGSENPHDFISPHLSAKFIADHVKWGEDLARQHHLPEAIVDIIREHHGTSPISYFLNKAREDQKQKDQRLREPIDEEEYRYHGPKPHRKESAIIMLADCVEAAVRALKDPTPEKIERVINDVIRAKIADGQLDESSLTFHEVQEIKRAFLETFRSIYHKRIEYPEEATKSRAQDQRAHNSLKGKTASPPQKLRPEGPTSR